MKTEQRTLLQRVKYLELSKEKKEELVKIIETVFNMIKNGEK